MLLEVFNITEKLGRHHSLYTILTFVQLRPSIHLCVCFHLLFPEISEIHRPQTWCSWNSPASKADFYIDRLYLFPPAMNSTSGSAR